MRGGAGDGKRGGEEQGMGREEGRSRDGKRGREVRRGGGSGEFRNLEGGASATGM